MKMVKHSASKKRAGATLSELLLVKNKSDLNRCDVVNQHAEGKMLT